MKHVGNLPDVLVVLLSVLELKADTQQLLSHLCLPWLLYELVIRDVGHLDFVALLALISAWTIIDEEGRRQESFEEI